MTPAEDSAFPIYTAPPISPTSNLNDLAPWCDELKYDALKCRETHAKVQDDTILDLTDSEIKVIFDFTDDYMKVDWV